MRLKWLVAGSLALCACAPGGDGAAEDTKLRVEAPAEDAESPQVPVEAGRSPARDSARDHWVETAFAPGNTLRSVIAAFGEPDTLATTTQPNQYDTTATDTIHRAVYNGGLTVRVYQGNGGKEFLIGAAVTGRGFLRSSAVDIGTPWSTVIERFGPPLGELGGVPYYDSLRREGPDEPVYFEVEDGIVRRLRFDYYTG